MSSTNLHTDQKILKAAIALLEEGAGAKTRMSDIAKAAGISRQAVYLHYPSRAELLIAAARYLDELKDVDARLAKSRAAASGLERLEAYIEAWGNYIPEIWGVGKAFIAMSDTDEAAAAAWSDRMQAVRHGCAAAVDALKADGVLRSDYTSEAATDLLWTLLSVEAWRRLTHSCGWSQQVYIDHVTTFARNALVKS